jgi:hypothetical protein
MARSCRIAVLVVLLLSMGLIGFRPAQAQSFAGVLTWHNDLGRTGQNLNETILTPSNVNSTQFGKKFSYAVDGQIYAQPLYVPNLNIPGQGVHNVVYVATENDSVYAFDADGLVPTPLWQVSFINPPSITTMPCTLSSQPACDPTEVSPQRGVTATPVIDSVAGTIYVVAKTVENNVYRLKLHALDITTCAERSGSPVAIQATAPGYPNTQLHAIDVLDRPGLVLENGMVYIALLSDVKNHGWLLGYDSTTLAQTSVFCVTPSGARGSIWSAGAAPAADSNGNLYLMTADGTFDALNGGVDYGMTMLQLTPGAGTLNVVDYFTPFNASQLSSMDKDLGSAGVVVLPDQPGALRHEVIGGGKSGDMFVVNRDNMGKFNPTKNNVVQTVSVSTRGFHNSPGYWNHRVYLSAVNSPLQLYRFINGKFVTPPDSQSSETFGYPGTAPTISANGTTNGIVWAIEVPNAKSSGNQPAVLHAYDATNLATELYNSSQAGTRDTAGPGIKFSVPTIANGQVYIGTETELDVYALL